MTDEPLQPPNEPAPGISDPDRLSSPASAPSPSAPPPGTPPEPPHHVHPHPHGHPGDHVQGVEMGSEADEEEPPGSADPDAPLDGSAAG